MPQRLIKNSPPTKKEVERRQLDRFIEALPTFPEGSIEESEEPDFIIRSSRRSIGIELTSLYWETPQVGISQQAQESLRHRIIKTAERLYSARNLPSLQVSIHFSPNYTPNKKDVQRLASAIDGLISQRVPMVGNSYSEDYDWENRNYFPEEINHICAWNLPNTEASFFSSPSAAFVPILESNDILRVLASKESKIPRYRQRCDEVWLIVNFDQGQLSTFFEHNEDVVEQIYSSDFDRIYLLRHIGSRIYELKLNFSQIKCPTK